MKRINLMCPINPTGYGITSYNIYKELRKLHDIVLFPLGGNMSVDPGEDQKEIIADYHKQAAYSKNDPCFKIWHQFDLANRIGIGKYIGLTFFEVDKLTTTEVNMINQLDHIFVASGWAKEVLEQNGITISIGISPLGIDPTIFNNQVNYSIRKNKDKYVFANIGKWEIRKGHDVLLEMFNRAFNENDNVELWMLNYNFTISKQDNEQWINKYKNSKLGSKIKIFDRLPNHTDVAKFIAMSDCGIFPARAEGWNNEVPEFFALNKPVILTNYSAHTQYANSHNSFLIDINELEPAVDGKYFKGFGNWAKIGPKEIDNGVELMKFVYKYDVRDNLSGLTTATSLTWNNTAKIISQEF